MYEDKILVELWMCWMEDGEDVVMWLWVVFWVRFILFNYGM